MSKPMTDARLTELESYANDGFLGVGLNQYAVYELIQEVRKLLAEREALLAVVESIRWCQHQEYHHEDCEAGEFGELDFDRNKCDCTLTETQDALNALDKLKEVAKLDKVGDE